MQANFEMFELVHGRGGARALEGMNHLLGFHWAAHSTNKRGAYLCKSRVLASSIQPPRLAEG